MDWEVTTVSKPKKKLSVKARNIIVTAAIAGTIILGLLIWLIVELVPFYGTVNNHYWVVTQKLNDADYVVEIEKDKDRDFVVLNFTDIQYNDVLDIGGKAKSPDETMRRAVEAVRPDLITVTGDLVWAAPFTRHSVMHLIDVIDGFGIPWAPVFGNHDENGNHDKAWFADRLIESKHCVMRRGPNNIGGLGNYIINIKEGDTIVHSMFMIDSGNERYYPEIGKNGYDFIGAEKQAWYRWAVGGLKEMNGGVTPRSSLFLHIPLPEYKTAYESYQLKDEKGNFLTDENESRILDRERFEADGGFGKNGEDVFCAPVNSGFFDVIKAEGSTFDIVAAHDHVNNSSIVYEGIRLTYGMKTGDRCYWDNSGDMNGGTRFTIGSNGVMATEHVYIKL